MRPPPLNCLRHPHRGKRGKCFMVRKSARRPCHSTRSDFRNDRRYDRVNVGRDMSDWWLVSDNGPTSIELSRAGEREFRDHALEIEMFYVGARWAKTPGLCGSATARRAGVRPPTRRQASSRRPRAHRRRRRIALSRLATSWQRATTPARTCSKSASTAAASTSCTDRRQLHRS
jgi:hypothetical protein